DVVTGVQTCALPISMLGEVEKDRLVTTGGAQVGDAVVMTKGVPLEGAAIIAREKEAELRALGITPTVIRRARGFLKTPGLSVRQIGRASCRELVRNE